MFSKYYYLRFEYRKKDTVKTLSWKVIKTSYFVNLCQLTNKLGREVLEIGGTELDILEIKRIL